MITKEKKSILQLLVALAWADGRVDEKERELVSALTEAFLASKEEAEEIMSWAKQARQLDEVDISSLSRSDMELALQYGVLLTWIDGEQSADEVTQLDKLISLLGFTREEAQPVLDSASAFAQTLLPELES
ncbi:MAG: TerB family tellurite resistance protein [Deltaproteobacteria bacterium]|nr:TerB family tellurite resistance protein [Deltaproteobacteria bacterium]